MFNQGIGRALHPSRPAQGVQQTPHQGGFSGTEIAGQEDAAAGHKLSGEIRAERERSRLVREVESNLLCGIPRIIHGARSSGTMQK